MKLLPSILIHLLATMSSAAEIAFEKLQEFPAEAFDLIARYLIVWFGELHGTKNVF